MDVSAVGDDLWVTVSDINGYPYAKGLTTIVNDNFFVSRGTVLEEWVTFSNPWFRTLFPEGLRIQISRVEKK